MENWGDMKEVSLFPAVDDEIPLFHTEPGVIIENTSIIKNNIYKVPKKTLVHRDLRNITCNCPIPPGGTNQYPIDGVCGQECINKILFIECYGNTPCGKRCGNRQMQSPNKLTFLLFKCGKKGLGLKCEQLIRKGEYVLEFVGEIIDRQQFEQRSKMYAENKYKHSYIMELRSKYFIDATQMGGIARYINHSCDPNLVSQKWSIHGYTRIGFFAICDIEPGVELTFDYKFERFGEPQRCFCGSANCTGYMGKSKKIPVKNKKEIHKPVPSEIINKPIKSVKTPSTSENVSKPEKNPLAFMKYMFKLLDWHKRLKVLKYLKESCTNEFLSKLVNCKLPKLLVVWMSQLDSHKYDISYYRKIIEVFKVLPIVNRNQLPFHPLLDALNGWMRKAASRHIKGENSEIVEFGRLCRVFMDHLAELPQVEQEPTIQSNESFAGDSATLSNLNIIENINNKNQTSSKENQPEAQESNLSAEKENPKTKFKFELSKYVVGCIRPYFSKVDPSALINNSDKFLSIARNLTHILYQKELENFEEDKMELDFTEDVRRRVYHHIAQYVKHSKRD